MSPKILIVDDSADDADLLVRRLRRGGLEPSVERVETPQEMSAALGRQHWDLVISDYSMPLFDGVAALRIVRAIDGDLPFILVSGTIGEDVAVDAMKAGANDYILKDNLARLPLAVEREIHEAKVRREGRRMEARYRSLFDRVPVGVFTTTPAGAILEANPAMVAMLGFADADALKRTSLDDLWLHRAEYERLQTLLARDGVVRDFEMQFRRHDGDLIWCAQNVLAMGHAGGAIDRYECVAVDITERRRAVDDLERSNNDLEQFASVASHDLREPLRMVRGFTELFARRYHGALDPVADEYVAHIVDGVRRMEQLIESLLRFARTGRGEPFGSVDLNQVADRVLFDLARAIEERHATVSHGLLPHVRGDADALSALLTNLISNAIKFVRNKPPVVRLEAEATGKEWIFSVTDNGIGIEAKNLDAIFAMFRRLHTQGEFPGSGIGLANCKRIVERHRGRIWVESRPGAGSTFRFTLPK